MRRCCVLLLGMATVSEAEVLPLSALLDGAETAPAVRATEADLAMLEALRRQREAEAGWHWFASAGVGRYRELVTNDRREDYYGRDLALGLRHPLLGSLYRQRDAVRSVETERQQQIARGQLYRAEHRQALRSAYGDWWRAQQERRWCAGLVEDAANARQSLAERLRTGWLLASEAHLLDGRWQALQRRCAETDQILDETLHGLRTLSGQSIEPWQQAQAETLSASASPLSTWLPGLETHPRLQARREQLQWTEQNREQPWYAGIDSSFSVAQSHEDRNGASKPGGGLVASLSLSAPFDPLSYGRARDNTDEARHQSALAQLEAEREQLVMGLTQALRAQRQSIEELSQARQQLEAASLAVREQRLRRDGELDQAFLGALAAELDYGYAGLRLIAAWHGLWLSEAALRLFAEHDGSVAPLPGPATIAWQALEPIENAPLSATRDAWRQGAYVWDSRSLLDPHTRDEALYALHEAGMQRIYLGLGAQQVSQLEQTRGQLTVLLDDARTRDLEIVLLLGDPQWLLPDARQGLLDLIDALAALPFAALHLDLEVEQLGWPVPQTRLKDWMDTLAEVALISPWPLELSSHHRWFDPPNAGELCVPCSLSTHGVRQVSLMIYTRNPERSAELSERIARRWPALRFRLAQSVEPQLTEQETWHGASRAQLTAQSERWRLRLQPLSVTGIDWQDWSFYPH